MGKKICGYCFTEVPDEGVDFCPNCGKPFSEQNPSGTLPIGSILGGRYVIGCLLGRGNRGITYRALSYQERRPVAIGEYFPRGACERGSNGITVIGSSGAFPESRDAFLQSAQGSSDLGAQGCGSVSDRFEENGTAYLVMSLVSNQCSKPQPPASPEPSIALYATPPELHQSDNQVQHSQQDQDDKKLSKAAIVALVCGIIGFFIGGIPLGCAAMIAGGQGVRESKDGGKHENTAGLFMGAAGLVLGIIDMVGVIVIH